MAVFRFRKGFSLKEERLSSDEETTSGALSLSNDTADTVVSPDIGFSFVRDSVRASSFGFFGFVAAFFFRKGLSLNDVGRSSSLAESTVFSLPTSPLVDIVLSAAPALGRDGEVVGSVPLLGLSLPVLALFARRKGLSLKETDSPSSSMGREGQSLEAAQEIPSRVPRSSV